MIFFSPLCSNFTVATGLCAEPSIFITSPKPNFWCSTRCPSCRLLVSLAAKSAEGTCSTVFAAGFGAIYDGLLWVDGGGPYRFSACVAPPNPDLIRSNALVGNG